MNTFQEANEEQEQSFISCGKNVPE